MTLSGKTQQHLGRCCDTKQSRERLELKALLKASASPTF